jgi:hypothetical protein
MLKPLVLLIMFALTGCAPARVSSETPSNASVADLRPTPASDPEPVTIAAVGDIMLGSPYPNESRMPPNDGADLLKEMTPILSAADIAFGNLEGPMTDDGVSEKCRPGSKACFAFRMPTRYNKYLKDAGFDVMSLANNHAGDFGDTGRADTRDALDAVGIKHAGSDRAEFSTTIVESKGKRIAFVGFGHNSIVPNINELEAARQYVVNAKEKADIVVVSFHGGAEGTGAQFVPTRTELYYGEERGNLPLFSRTVIDAGADLVLGHGPHVLRGIEIHKDRLIAYSLGNFATYGWFQLMGETALTMVLEVRLAPDGKFLDGKIHAGRQEGGGIPVLDKSGKAIRVVRTLSNKNFGSNAPKIEVDGTISRRASTPK